MDLAKFTNPDFDRGAPAWKEALWCALGSPLVRSIFAPSGLRTAVLRLFGARIGRGGRIKNDVRVKFPWKLTVGDCVWLGESVWIDNLESVTMGRSVCVSQGAYLCTGNHDWSDPFFGLQCRPIVIEDQVWIGAQSRVGPGVTVREGAVLAMAGVALGPLEAWSVYQGDPAKKIRDRRVRSGPA